MSRRRETPSAFLHDHDLSDQSQPVTDAAALMQSDFGATPPISKEAAAPLRELLGLAVDEMLDARERWIFEALVLERKTLREVGAELSLAHSWVWELHQRACHKLADALANDPIIAPYLSGAARQKEEMS